MPIPRQPDARLLLQRGDLSDSSGLRRIRKSLQTEKDHMEQ